jgi:Fe-S-cluster-containing dehydrogenase component
MAAYGWLIDEKRCIECRACESACKMWNQVETGVGVRRRQVRVYTTGVFPQVRQQALTGACYHCENAWCMKVCPVKAIWRRDEDGVVLIDQEKCVGCQQCAMFCPYGAPQFNLRTRKMDKCTMCFDRLEQGLDPACVTLCPTGALRYGPWEEVQKQGAETTANFAPPRQTRPKVRFIQEGFPTGK